jgi:hypothetical protein
MSMIKTTMTMTHEKNSRLLHLGGMLLLFLLLTGCSGASKVVDADSIFFEVQCDATNRLSNTCDKNPLFKDTYRGKTYSMSRGAGCVVSVLENQLFLLQSLNCTRIGQVPKGGMTLVINGGQFKRNGALMDIDLSPAQSFVALSFGQGLPVHKLESAGCYAQLRCYVQGDMLTFKEDVGMWQEKKPVLQRTGYRVLLR